MLSEKELLQLSIVAVTRPHYAIGRSLLTPLCRLMGTIGVLGKPLMRGVHCALSAYLFKHEFEDVIGQLSLGRDQVTKEV